MKHLPFKKQVNCKIWDYFLSAHANMLGRPYLGQKAYDVARVLQWLQARGHHEIHLAARGWGALAAAMAAPLCPAVERVTLKNALTSWTDVASDPDYQWPYAALPPGVLQRFDLPDAYRALASKHLRQIEPWGPRDGMKE